jgi:hypothetical protein
MRSSPGRDPFRRGSDVAHAKDLGQFGQGDTSMRSWGSWLATRRV